MQDYSKCKHISCLKYRTEKEFNSLLNGVQEPVKIEGLMSEWKATELWSYDYLKQSIGSREVIVRNQERQPFGYYTLRLSRMIDLVIQDRPFKQYSHFAHHMDSTMKDDYWMPDYFSCWYKKLPISDQKLSLSWIYLGTRYSYSELHVDIYNTSAWNAVFIGKKLWLFYAPDQVEFLYGGQVDPFNPDHRKYPEFRNANPLICLQGSNEIVYTPSGWWHSVINLKPGFALTENFINELNFERVKQDLVSMGAKKAIGKLESLKSVNS